MHYWINQFLATPDQPGGTRHIDFAARLRRQGVPVELVASDFNLTARRYTRRGGGGSIRPVTEEVDGVPVHFLWAAPYRGNDWRRYANMVSFGAAVGAFLSRAPVVADTVFIGSSPSLLAAQAAAFAAAFRGVRFVLEVRDLWPESLIEVSGRDGAVARVLRRIADDLYRRADRIIVLAEGSIGPIVDRGIDRGKIVCVPNSVDPAQFATPSSYPDVTLRADRFCAIYAGAHGAANDLDTLVEAARLLQEGGNDRVQIVLVGDGPEKPRLVGRVRSQKLGNVTFLDPVPKAAIPGLFSRCHAGILVLRDLPLFRYGVSPNKLFDYMAAGLPVVTNVPGECTDIITRAGCGVCVAPGNPRALADGLAALAGDPTATARGAAGRRHVLEHFNRDNLVGRLRNVILGTQRGPA